ncbi:Protocadherin-11 X-linked, partial [Anabarilius grahami]
LPDGSQESCSDSGLGEQEPNSGASTTQPLPLGFPQEEYYEQTSPNSRTEGDGNSDPESNGHQYSLLIFATLCSERLKFATASGRLAKDSFLLFAKLA